MTRNTPGRRHSLRALGRLTLVAAVTSVAVIASATVSSAATSPTPTPATVSAAAVLDDPALQELREQFAALPEGGEMGVPLAEGTLTVAKQDGIATVATSEINRLSGSGLEAAVSSEEPGQTGAEQGAHGASNTCKTSAVVAAGIMLLGVAAIGVLLLFSPGGAVVAGVFLSAKVLTAAAGLLGSFAALELFLANYVC